MPGVTIRKAREKSFESLRAAFTACQAISMAMTVVLPLPVAIFRARRKSSGLASSLRLGDLIQEALRRRAFRRDLGQPDDRLDGFDLAEERARADELVVAPMFQEPLRYARSRPSRRDCAGSPSIDVAADLVD